MMTSRRSELLMLTLGALLSCCCVRVLSRSAGPPDGICGIATQTPTGHTGTSAQTSASPYSVVVVGGLTTYDSDDTSTSITGSGHVCLHLSLKATFSSKCTCTHIARQNIMYSTLQKYGRKVQVQVAIFNPRDPSS